MACRYTLVIYIYYRYMYIYIHIYIGYILLLYIIVIYYIIFIYRSICRIVCVRKEKSPRGAVLLVAWINRLSWVFIWILCAWMGSSCWSCHLLSTALKSWCFDMRSKLHHGKGLRWSQWIAHFHFTPLRVPADSFGNERHWTTVKVKQTYEITS